MPFIKDKQSGHDPTVSRSVAGNLTTGGRSLPARPLQLKSDVVQLFTFSTEDQAILYFEDELLDDLDSNFEKVIELQKFAREKKWEDLLERIGHYLQEDSKKFMHMAINKLDTQNLASLPALIELLTAAQERGWEEEEELLLPLVRKLEDKRDAGIVEDRFPFADPEARDSQQHAGKIEENKQQTVANVFLAMMESKGKDRSQMEAYIPHVEAAHDPDPAKFADAQKSYQNLLTGGLGLSQAEIIDYHQSAGYEFEFASFVHQTKQVKEEEELMPSHVDLAHSEVISPVFGLPFKLETDSGNALEVATPPFLFLQSKNVRGLLGQVFDMYTKMSSGLEKALAGKPLKGTENEFPKYGFGLGWTLTAEADGLIATDNKKHRQGPYGQANVSMTAGEIAALLIKLSVYERQSSTMSITRSLSEPLYVMNTCNDLLKSEYKPIDGIDPKMEGAFLIYSRAIANLIAIPSILLRQRYSDYYKKPDPNYATEVKESLGLWIKDNPHRVLFQYMYDLEDPAIFREVIQRSQEGVLKIITDRLKVHEPEVKRWMTAMKEERFNLEIAQEADVIKKIVDAKTRMQSALALVERKNKKNQLVGEVVNAAFSIYNTTYYNSMIGELSAFNRILIAGKEPLVPERAFGKTTFLNERFGLGLGVRKDTYLGSMSGEHRTLRVGELRGREELRLYEEGK